MRISDWSSDVCSSDLGSIQVLKGPQGTLFGRNATGGAVLYSTPMPGDEFSGFVILRGASRDYGQMQAAIDLPLIPGKRGIPLAGDITRGEGSDRKSAGLVKGVSVGVDFEGGR